MAVPAVRRTDLLEKAMGSSTDDKVSQLAVSSVLLLGTSQPNPLGSVGRTPLTSSSVSFLDCSKFNLVVIEGVDGAVGKLLLGIAAETSGSLDSQLQFTVKKTPQIVANRCWPCTTSNPSISGSFDALRK
jgi:hypothetical protein